MSSGSFWQRLGEVANTATISSALGVAWDATVATPAKTVLGALRFPYNYGINRPGGTFNMVANDAAQGKANFFDPGVWRRRWNDSAQVSIGQSALAGGSFFQAKMDGADVTSTKAQEYFKNDPMGIVTSGAYDFAANLLDPTFFAGKGVKAVRTAQTTFANSEVRDIALKLSSGELTPAAAKLTAGRRVTRQAVRNQTRMDAFLASTRGQSVTQLMQNPVLRDTGDSGALAYWMARADKEAASDTAALAAKRDVFAVALGNKAAADQLAMRNAGLLDEMKQMTAPVDQTRAQALFNWDDNGQGMIDFFNTNAPADFAARQTAIRDELTRLERLQAVQGSTSRFAATGLEKAQASARGADLIESVQYDGIGSRPIRVVRGTIGKATPGSINLKVADQGIDELRRVLGRSTMPAEKRSQLLQDYALAPTREQRFIAVQNAEAAIIRTEGEAFGKTPAEVKQLASMIQGRRAAVAGALRSSLYSAAPDATYIRYIDGEDGVVHAFDRPFLQSQLEDMAPVTDPKLLRNVLKQELRTGWLGDMARGGQYVTDITNDIAMQATSAWKNIQLFRGAYPLRVQVDSQMRLGASIGALQYMLTAARGTKNLLTRGPSDLLRPEFYGSYADQAAVDRLTPQLDQLNTRLQARLADPKANPDLTAQITAKRDAIAEELGRAQATPINIAAAQNPDEFNLLKRSLGSTMTRDLMMADTRTRFLRGFRSSGNFGVVKGSEANWSSAYQRAVNQQIRNSPVAMRMLADPSNESVAKFVASDAAASKEWANFAPSWNNQLSDWLDLTRAHVNHTVPDPNVRAVALQRQVNAKDMATYFGDVTKRPDVHGDQMVPTFAGPTRALFQKVRDGWYNVASDIPEAVMAKQPLYNNRFRTYMQDVINRQGGDVLTAADVERARKIADRKARIDVGNTMFDLSDTSNMAYMARFISPFFAAWEDTMTKWGRLLYDDPSRAVRLTQAWQAPNRADLVTTDQQGTEMLVLPKRFAPVEGAGSLAIRKNSFNIVFQGQPWWLPGFGGLVQAPINQIVRDAFPKEAGDPVFKYLLPYGVSTESIPSQLAPAWFRRAKGAFQQNSDAYKQTYTMLLAQEITKFQNGDRAKLPTREEIANATRNWNILRALTAFASPVSANPVPEFQFYIDQARNYRNNDSGYRAAYKAWQDGGSQGQAPPNGWQEAFYQAYPQYYLMGISLSRNNTGIVASAQAYDALKANRKQIAENPDYGWFFVGPDNTGPFNHGVYAFQRTQAIGSGNTETFRTRGDPVAAVQQGQAEQGWMDYRKGMTGIQLALEDRGLYSLSQRGAEDLAAMKRKFVEQLSAENPAWAAARLQRDNGKARNFLEMASKNLGGSIAKRPDVKVLQEYLQGRRMMQQAMASRGVSRLPDAASVNSPNADLRAVWDRFTATLVASNIGFEQMWQRALESDDLAGNF